LVDLEERQLDGIRKALASIDNGLGAAHCDVEVWVASWDGNDELPVPELVKTTGPKADLSRSHDHPCLYRHLRCSIAISGHYKNVPILSAF
jgi:hypothetical protein